VSPARAAILAPEGLTLSARETAFFREADPWGFIVFARNLATAAQIRKLTDDLRQSVGRDAPVLIDQEGGRVQRLRPPLARDWPPPLDHVAAAGPRAARVMALRYRIIAAELIELGIDCNCAPMLDIARAQTHEFLRNRCYGSSVAQVASIGHAVAGGLMDGGVLPVIKHIPGHGRALFDSHLDLPRIDTPAAELETVDFAPFKALAELPMGMTAHLVFEAFDPLPATISPVMIGKIRDEIGFEGLLMTDDISMQALSGTVAERSAASLAAGCDVVLHCNGDMAEMEDVAAACGSLTLHGARRAASALGSRHHPRPVDIDALTAELEALMTDRLDG